jgi:hypothetical protein
MQKLRNELTYSEGYGYRHVEGLEPPMTPDMQICGKPEPEKTDGEEKEAKLKPCPICGGEAQLEDYRDGGGNGYAVHCQTFTCQTCGPVDLGISGAIEQWNSRPLEDALKDELVTEQARLDAAKITITEISEKNERLRGALAFAKSVILSGESMTPEAEAIINGALNT